jgi:4-alpha-glucanotransferase
VPKFQLVLLIHAHQPVGNFDDVLESAYAKSYLPFVELLEKHPAIRLGLHYSGSLLEWIERAHPEYFGRLKRLANREQVEIVGGGFYEPILVAIPPEDQQEQIRRLSEYIERHFQTRPRGAWLAERVWEPQLPSTLGPAGVEYSLVDDNHFLGAGFELSQMFGYYVAEDMGATVKVLPGLKSLRYLIPFRGVDEITQFLHGAANDHPGGFAAMGDDLEKFGVWPGTYEHCYRNGWLENFFSALERCSDWLEMSTPGEAVSSHPPLGRADLPTASYTEMMEWALPTPARNRYHGLTQEFSARPDCLPFLRGGIWRGFFSKYSESNLLHKKMLHVSKKLQLLANSRRRDAVFCEARERARTLLLRGQCNDPYWHGVFGGLYAPHLRTAVWRSLVEAEAIADSLRHRSRHFAEAAPVDFNADGRDEIYLASENYAALVDPNDGGTLCALDFRPAKATLINSLMRRAEAYHAALRNLPARNAGGVQSIHDQTRTKEEGLERWLNYDRWPRHAFRFLLFGREKKHEDCLTVRLDESPALAAGRYRVVEVSPGQVVMTAEESRDWPAQKKISLKSEGNALEAECEVTLGRQAQGTASVQVGIEMILNFLAPSTPDRYFESGGQRYPLRWAASVPGRELRVVDEWQGVDVMVATSHAQRFWITPIDTVSESEGGFERIYQGSQIIAVWPVELAPGENWKGKLKLRVTPFVPPH